MSLANKFSNIKDFWRKAASGTGMTLPEAEQAYLAAAADHQDLERRMQVLDCRHGSVLHTLRVLRAGSY